jgi:3-deoxy-7-phosphoheptulonate synthase
MIIVIKPGTQSEIVDEIVASLEVWGLSTQMMVGKENVVLGLIGDTSVLEEDRVKELSPFIDRVMRVKKRYKRASREFHPDPSTVMVRGIPIGEEHPLVLMTGPCSVENEAMILETAQRVKAAGAQFLRGGAYKPRTSPYDFQGHGESALGLLALAREKTGLGIVTELMDTEDLEVVAETADMIQIGARNMQNFSLLKKVGLYRDKQGKPKPVLLKRGMNATIDEWLSAAEYILAAGNPDVVLCERGIRTFDKQYTRNTLDLSVIPVLRSLTHLPIVIDPSHGTGVSEYVKSMSLAAAAAGTDGLMVEVHPTPAKALSDGPQSLTPDKFDDLVKDLAKVAGLFGRWPKEVAKV